MFLCVILSQSAAIANAARRSVTAPQFYEVEILLGRPLYCRAEEIPAV